MDPDEEPLFSIASVLLSMDARDFPLFWVSGLVLSLHCIRELCNAMMPLARWMFYFWCKIGTPEELSPLEPSVICGSPQGEGRRLPPTMSVFDLIWSYDWKESWKADEGEGACFNEPCSQDTNVNSVCGFHPLKFETVQANTLVRISTPRDFGLIFSHRPRHATPPPRSWLMAQTMSKSKHWSVLLAHQLPRLMLPCLTWHQPTPRWGQCTQYVMQPSNHAPVYWTSTQSTSRRLFNPLAQQKPLSSPFPNPQRLFSDGSSAQGTQKRAFIRSTVAVCVIHVCIFDYWPLSWGEYLIHQGSWLLPNQRVPSAREGQLTPTGAERAYMRTKPQKFAVCNRRFFLPKFNIFFYF